MHIIHIVIVVNLTWIRHNKLRNTYVVYCNGMSATMMTVFVRWFHPGFVFLLITVPLGNKIPYMGNKIPYTGNKIPDTRKHLSTIKIPIFGVYRQK